ncbi:MAG: DUF309 domain-containing protein [Sulfurovum sp.]|nr:DUF309 domain-containing protein [Sulfurovum sp.]MCB4775263.1 DUF309 domain-containing protein [Sulfurovum sp.]MCB4777866.1 DUF309 domain-containing protein [Sulfurovum sp.]MCB4779265.1 DUF309 domain-containing protein [Sulfurovum sp.]
MSLANNDLEEILQTYLILMDTEKYFEAHEVLEEAWHLLRFHKDPLANLAKGLINGAIAFEHLKRNKERSVVRAQRVIVSYERHKHLCVEGIEYFILFAKACKKIEILKKKYMLHGV